MSEQQPIQLLGFYVAGLLCLGLAIVKLTAGEAMVVVESPAAVLDHGGPQRALYSDRICVAPFR